MFWIKALVYAIHLPFSIWSPLQGMIDYAIVFSDASIISGQSTCDRPDQLKISLSQEAIA